MSSILIRDGSVFTAQGWLEPGHVLIAGAAIQTVGPGEPTPDVAAQAETVLSARHMAVLPGLVNAHTHLSQTFMRGLAAGRPLLRWLKELIWPLQAAMSADEMRLAAMLGLVENLRCGVTHVVDHHKITATPAHTDAVLDAARAVGLRLTLARAWADRGANAEAPQSILEDLERLFEMTNVERRMTNDIRHSTLDIASGPLTPWRCSAETLRQTHELARRYGGATHIHVSEARDEVEMTLKETGLRPVAWLDALGVLGPDTQIVHAVWVDEAEIELLAQRRALVVHCPVSNAVLGSGAAPIKAMLAGGVNLRLGTDGPASNDTQDLFETIKWAVGLARVSTLDPTALAPADALRMATGGRALADGGPADVILVDLNHSRAMPAHDTGSALALCSHGSDVDTVIVGGRLRMQDKRALAVDEAALLGECRAVVQGLRARARVSLDTPHG
jgi:5-methylthioadenosine/S-adenosylhomocysteine deaminase